MKHKVSVKLRNDSSFEIDRARRKAPERKKNYNTFPFSTSLVIMAMTLTSSCHIMRQKSSIVFGRQPWVAMYVLSLTVTKQITSTIKFFKQFHIYLWLLASCKNSAAEEVRSERRRYVLVIILRDSVHLYACPCLTHAPSAAPCGVYRPSGNRMIIFHSFYKCMH